ncbi:hypothetical protein PFISCL1PPCAC_7277, partial [Pristionchus fissidentatus]
VVIDLQIRTETRTRPVPPHSHLLSPLHDEDSSRQETSTVRLELEHACADCSSAKTTAMSGLLPFPLPTFPSESPVSVLKQSFPHSSNDLHLRYTRQTREHSFLRHP